jgi:hypothetical protein
LFKQVSEKEENFPQFGVTTASTTISIFVADENDNQPRFNEMSYSAYIADTAQLNYPIQFENETELFIEDKDQVNIKADRPFPTTFGKKYLPGPVW